MKKILILIICCLGLMSCENENVIYSNTKYVIAKVNDTIIAIIPFHSELRKEGVNLINLKNIQDDYKTVDKKINTNW